MCYIMTIQVLDSDQIWGSFTSFALTSHGGHGGAEITDLHSRHTADIRGQRSQISSCSCRDKHKIKDIK